MSIESNTLDSAREQFREYKALAERAIAQLSDDELHREFAHEANSVAVIMRHMAGNMRSRWIDFLTTDGEKPTRNRDTEFEEPTWSRQELMADWESGWNAVFAAVDPLTPSDLARLITIRGKTHTVIEAMHRQISHYAYHIGQIVMLAKSLRGDDWKTLSIARGASAAYIQELAQSDRKK